MVGGLPEDSEEACMQRHMMPSPGEGGGVRVVIWGRQQKSGKEEIEESELGRKQEESEEKTSPGSTQG